MIPGERAGRPQEATHGIPEQRHIRRIMHIGLSTAKEPQRPAQSSTV